MKRHERSEYTQMKNAMKGYDKRGTINTITMLTIRTNAGSE